MRMSDKCEGLSKSRLKVAGRVAGIGREIMCRSKAKRWQKTKNVNITCTEEQFVSYESLPSAVHGLWPEC